MDRIFSPQESMYRSALSEIHRPLRFYFASWTPSWVRTLLHTVEPSCTPTRNLLDIWQACGYPCTSACLRGKSGLILLGGLETVAGLDPVPPVWGADMAAGRHPLLLRLHESLCLASEVAVSVQEVGPGSRPPGSASRAAQGRDVGACILEPTLLCGPHTTAGTGPPL